jgi:membrane-associated phospholipid phosphatase
LMAAHLLAEVDPVAGAVGSTYAALLGLALVWLGEHYAVDLLGGAVLTESVRRVAPKLAPAARRFSAALQALEARAHPA